MGIHRQKGDQVARGSVPDFLPIDFVILGESVKPLIMDLDRMLIFCMALRKSQLSETPCL